MAAFGLITGWYLFRGFRTGFMVFHQPGGPMTGSRRDQPIRFWLVAALLMFLCGASWIVVVALAFDLGHV